jgi:deoxyadenosine/deoxycytidine kinase
LNERYEAWIHDYDKKNLIILEVDDLNFVDNPEDLQKVVEVIDDKLGKMKMDAK